MNTYTKARAGLVLDHPFWAQLALKLEPVPTPGSGRIQTEGKKLFYDPAKFDGFTPDEAIFVFAHEAAHCALEHPYRKRQEWTHELFNRAADYAVNSMLSQSGMTIPDWALHDTQYDGMTLEQIYRALDRKGPEEDPQHGQPKSDPNAQSGQQQGPQGPQGPPDPQGQPQPNGQPQGPQQPPDPQGTAQQGPPDPNAQPDPNGQPQQGPQGQPTPPPQPQQPPQGQPDPNGQPQGQQGQQGQPEQGPPDPQTCNGEVTQADPADQDPKAAAQEWRQALIAAAKAEQKRHGKLPGVLAELVAEAKESRVDWREALHQFFAQTARDDYSWSRPNRRYAHCGVILPSLRSESLPPVWIAIDTSGSVSQEQLDQFLSEVQAVLDQYPTAEIHLAACDTELSGPFEFHGGDDIMTDPPKMQRGGGTSFCPVFEAVEASGDTPAGLVYITDLAGRFPDNPPDFPVLWITDARHRTAPFGETVRIRE